MTLFGLVVILMTCEVKIVMVGDSLAGKTSIVSQFCKHTFADDDCATVGAYFVTKVVPTNGCTMCVHIWDTAGQERYRSLIPMYLRGAGAAIMVIDGSSASSYDSIQPWYDTLVDLREQGCLIYLIVNKSDLETMVPMGRVREWANETGVPVFQATAKEYSSVEPIFQRIAQDLSDKIQEADEFGDAAAIRRKLELSSENKKCC